MKYPLNKPIVGDGLHCRVCGCTQHNACPEGCGWVKEPSYTYEVMGPLCTACAGTPNDLAFINRLVSGFLLPWSTPRGKVKKRLRLILLAAARRGEERAASEREVQ